MLSKVFVVLVNVSKEFVSVLVSAFLRGSEFFGVVGGSNVFGDL